VLVLQKIQDRSRQYYADFSSFGAAPPAQEVDGEMAGFLSIETSENFEVVAWWFLRRNVLRKHKYIQVLCMLV